MLASAHVVEATPKVKAWLVRDKRHVGDFCECEYVSFVRAETRGKAIMISDAYQNRGEWTQMVATRVPVLDSDGEEGNVYEFHHDHYTNHGVHCGTICFD